MKLVVTVYEFFGEDTAQIEFTPADGCYPFLYISRCEKIREENRQREENQIYYFMKYDLKHFFNTKRNIYDTIKKHTINKNIE